MKISEAGIYLIKRFEGLELESYQDIAGVWTIGYGHTETAGPNQKISEREAEELLRRDLGPRERAIEQLVGVALNQNEFDALVSFVFNVGANAFKNSTARKRLNRNDRVGAAEALTWWNKATVNGVLREVLGLTRRRAAERALFLTPVNPPIVSKPEAIAENSRLTPVEEAPRRENLGESRTVQGAAVAGGAGAAASSIGRQSAEDLDQLETNIEQGTGFTEKPPGQGGLGDPGTAAGAPDGAAAGESSSGDGSTTDGGSTDE
ncbi:MAG: lysozyme, partial [Pseudomonadota bacterium]